MDEPFTGNILKDILGDIPGISPEDWLMRIAQTALGVALNGTDAVQMSLLITDDATVHNLNARFRGLDEVTGLDFVMPPGEPSPLGEVIVSYPQAERQAEERSTPLEHELALLVVHGVLHLTGHDHLESEETALMQSKERIALATLNSKA